MNYEPSAESVARGRAMWNTTMLGGLILLALLTCIVWLPLYWLGHQIEKLFGAAS